MTGWATGRATAWATGHAAGRVTVHVTGRSPGHAARRRERGFALLIVLWTVALFSLLVSAITAAGGGRASQAADLARNAQLRACADGGIEQAVFHVLDPSAARWLADGQPHRLRGDHDCGLVLSVTSQDGRIDPNTASAALLAGLLTAAGLDARTAPAVAEAMAAWRFPSTQPDAVPGRDYRSPGGPFESLDELGLVPGVTPDLLRRIRPSLTLYHEGDPNLADADPLVRRAVVLAAGAGASSQDGAPAPQSSDRFDPSVVEVLALASDAQGRRFLRRAIVLTGNAAGRDAHNAPLPDRIVAWDAP